MKNMKKTKIFLKILILTAAMVCLGFLYTGTADAMEPECEHEVYCYDRSTCIICGEENLQEEDIAKVMHPSAFCYDPTTCTECMETVEEDSLMEILHDVSPNSEYSRFVPDSDLNMHWVTCYCGEEYFDIPLPHQVSCQSEHQDVCDLCGWEGNIEVTTHTEWVFSDEDYHWIKCLDCGEMVMDKLAHYTYCTDPDGPCAFQYCERPHEECNFLEKYIGIHGNTSHSLIKVDGEYIHQEICHDCGEEVIYHHGVIYNDYGDDIDHGVACAECKYAFQDMPHGKHVITGEVEATCTEDGYTGDEICEDCGHVFKEGSVIKALGHEYKNGVCIRCGQTQNTPITGDESHMMTWLFIMVGALACIFLCGLRFGKIRK